MSDIKDQYTIGSKQPVPYWVINAAKSGIIKIEGDSVSSVQIYYVKEPMGNVAEAQDGAVLLLTNDGIVVKK